MMQVRDPGQLGHANIQANAAGAMDARSQLHQICARAGFGNNTTRATEDAQGPSSAREQKREPQAALSRWLGVRPAQLSKVSIAPTYLVLESGSAHLEGTRGCDGPHGGSSGGGAAWAAAASWRAWGSDAGMGQRGIGAVGTEGERHV